MTDTAPQGVLREPHLYIGGQWSAGRGADLEVENPTTEETTAVVTQASVEDVEADGVAAQELHHGGGDPVGLAADQGLLDRLLQDALGEHVEQHRVLRPGQVGRLGERADRVGAVGHGVGPPLAGDEAARVLLGEEPGGGVVAPLEDLRARQQVLVVVALQAGGEDQRAEAAAEHGVGA